MTIKSLDAGALAASLVLSTTGCEEEGTPTPQRDNGTAPVVTNVGIDHDTTNI